ncbi:hypothetical protein Y032_0015g2722 [Ancylostoma ceylanicum]|uniref:Uncharacterized protein n=1 Tax=Ancylostoma ceylanicum TaxID=53326 RepID=A0A016VA35_9BILA|nr:hypothetical protein Y032_0015g2722 [Ancylostoma ceylanicum]
MRNPKLAETTDFPINPGLHLSRPASATGSFSCNNNGAAVFSSCFCFGDAAPSRARPQVLFQLLHIPFRMLG